MTAITRDPETGWGFTIGKQPYTGFTSRDAAAEALYDMEHGGALYRAPAEVPAIPSIEEQIALLGPRNSRKPITLLDITLPTGETVEREADEGVPNDWITVTRGDVEMTVDANGVLGIEIGGCYVDDIPPEEINDLRALLTLDLGSLCRLADLGPEITEAIKVWYDMPNDVMKRTARTIGFAAWLHDPNRPRERCPREEAPPAVVAAPAPDDYAAREAELDAMWKRPRIEWPLEYRAAMLGIAITKLTDGRGEGLDPERAAALAGLLEPFAELSRARQIALIDSWLANPTIAAALAGALAEQEDIALPSPRTAAAAQVPEQQTA